MSTKMFEIFFETWGIFSYIETLEHVACRLIRNKSDKQSSEYLRNA